MYLSPICTASLDLAQFRMVPNGVKSIPNILPSGKIAQPDLEGYNLKVKMDLSLCHRPLTIGTPLVPAGYLGLCCPIQTLPEVLPPYSVIEEH